MRDSYSRILLAGPRSLSPYGWQLPTDLRRRTTRVAFYAEGSTGESFLEALIRATHDPTYFTGDKFILRDGVTFPTKRDPENVIRMADAQKVLGRMPIHLTLNLTYQPSSIPGASGGRPGFYASGEPVPLTLEQARVIDDFLGLGGTRHSLIYFANDVVGNAGQHATAADVLDAAAAANSTARPGLHPDVIGIRHMVDPAAYLHSLPQCATSLNPLVDEVATAIQDSPLGYNEQSDGAEPPNPNPLYSSRYPTVPRPPAHNAPRHEKEHWLVNVGTWMEPVHGTDPAPTPAAARHTSRKDVNDAARRLQELQDQMILSIQGFLPHRDVRARYPGMPADQATMGIEVLSRLAALLQFQLHTLEDLLADATSSATTEMATERVRYLIQPTDGVFARALDQAIFGDGSLGSAPTVTLFEVYTGCYDLPGIFVWAAYSLHKQAVKPTPEAVVHGSFEHALAAQLGYGVDVSQLLAALRRARCRLDRYGLGAQHRLALAEIASVLRRCGVMPSGFKAPGNEGVVLKLMMDDANSDDAFAPKVYAALEAEHELTKRFMGAAGDTIGTAAEAPDTTHIAAMFGGTTWHPSGALPPPAAALATPVTSPAASLAPPGALPPPAATPATPVAPPATSPAPQAPAVSAIDPAATKYCFRECRGLCNQGKPGYKRGKRDKLCVYVHLGSPHAPRYDDAEHTRMLRYIASSRGFDRSPFQESKLRRLNGISDDQVREILDKSRQRATAAPRATSATPPSTTTGYSLAAAQQSSLATPSGSEHVASAIRGYPTGKAIHRRLILLPSGSAFTTTCSAKTTCGQTPRHATTTSTPCDGLRGHCRGSRSHPIRHALPSMTCTPGWWTPATLSATSGIGHHTRTSH